MILRSIGRALTIIFGSLILVNLLFWGVWSIRQLLSDDPLADLPRVMLWAWERPEDLRFIDRRRAGIAYLAGTITLDPEGMDVRARMQPLLAPDDCAMVGVVRIEARQTELDPEQADRVADQILKLVPMSRVEALQVDFDAAVSQRPFYRCLLADLHRRLPVRVRLSMTALASWCIHDGWIEGLPVDEAVPMLFRMGVDDHEVRRYLVSGNDFLLPACRWSVGLSTDEGILRVPPGRRRYVFHPRPWEPEAVGVALRENWE